MTQAHPILVINDLERFAPAGVVASMDAAALGAFHRLLSHAWTQEPPCSLPADDATLAVVARTHARSEWDRVKPVILLAFAPTPDQLPGGTRLVNAVARGIYDQLAASTASRSDTNRRNARARWKPPPADASRMQVACDSDASGMRVAPSAPSLRPESSSLSLHRSNSERNSERPAERSDRDVIAQLSEGARAKADLDLAQWQRSASLEILQKHLAEWIRIGATDYPISKVSELASGEYSTPARVQAVCEDASARFAAADAKGESFGVIGWLINGLGLNRRGRVRPAPVPMAIELHWQKEIEERRKRLEANSALQASINRIRTIAANKGTSALGGGA